jgi:uncharacterized membrane protein YdbT with pleckstrin-like domain
MKKFFFAPKDISLFFFPTAVLLLLTLFLASNLGYAKNLNDLFGHINRGDQITALLAHLPLLILLFSFLVSGIQQGLTYSTSDYAVTNMRIIMKQGFFDRYVTDTRLTTISHVMIEQPLLGQILHYGTVIINNFGGSRDAFIQVSRPNEFQKAVQNQLIKLTQKPQ